MAPALLLTGTEKTSDSLALFPRLPTRANMAKEFPEFAETKAVACNLDGNGCFVEGLGQSIKALEGVIRELARSEVPVLLLAEAGSGKKATAERIHQMSAHRAEPFRIISCAEATEPMHKEDGRAAGGLFEAGTVYFEELADLNASCQELLLSVLRVGEGNGNGHTGRARLICGSARDLEAEVRAGRFREDTYYRVSGVCLRLPPLRQRREDIPSLVKFFLAKYARDFRRPVPQLSQATQLLFHDYAWPGNIRELEDAAKAIVALGDESVAMGGLRIAADAVGTQWQWRADFSEAGFTRGVARGGEGTDTQGAATDALESPEGSTGVADQLQGTALQVETDRVPGLFSVLRVQENI